MAKRSKEEREEERKKELLRTLRTARILPNILYQISDGEGAVLIIGKMEEKE